MKILIADDDATSRQMLSAVTARWGFDPVMAEDGLGVLKIMSESDPPSILMLDWEMPGLDGLSLAHHLTADDENVDPLYIILLTGRDANQDVVTGLAAGANDYVTKPFDPDILRARVAVARRTVELQSRLASALHDLELLAHVDELTRLPNRRAAMDAIGNEIARRQREPSALFIGICDIDYFKRINDTHGHSCGDAILRQTADLLRQSFRPYDVIGRYGGEEFIFSIGADETYAAMILERLRTTIAEHTFCYQDLTLQLTLSTGAVMVTTDTPCTVSSWLQKADEALYQAKGNGRDRVCFYQHDTDVA